MSILFSGDYHANARNELISLTPKSLLKKFHQDKYDSIKYHIMLGDAGFFHPFCFWEAEGKKDLKTLAKRPFPILCVIGEYDPILGMDNVPEVYIGIGETVLQVCDKPFIAYLKRGKIYTIEGFKFLVLGGALSVCKDHLEPNKTWWEGEYWTEREKQDLFKLLETENSFDFVLSHTGPHRINKELFENCPPQYAKKIHALPVSCISTDVHFDYEIPIHMKKFEDEVAFMNDEIDKKIQCRGWWCGHFHRNYYRYEEETQKGYQYLYGGTKILDKTDAGVVVYNEYGREKQ